MPFHCIDRLAIRVPEIPVDIDQIVENETMLIEVALGALKGLPSVSSAEMTALQPVLILLQDTSPVQKAVISILKQPNSNTPQPVETLKPKLDFRESVNGVLIPSRQEYKDENLTESLWYDRLEMREMESLALEEINIALQKNPRIDAIRASWLLWQPKEPKGTLKKILENTAANTTTGELSPPDANALWEENYEPLNKKST